jgi:hypothetical protein
VFHVGSPVLGLAGTGQHWLAGLAEDLLSYCL